MKVQTRFDPHSLSIRLGMEADDRFTGAGQGRQPVELVTNTARFRHQDLASDLHPDLLGLLVLTLVLPFVARRIALDVPVSSTFASAVGSAFGIEFVNIDDGLKPRQEAGRIALLLSGGTDSVAAKLVLPSDIAFVHHLRIRHPRIPNRATHLRVDVTREYALRGAEGQPLTVVESDVEFMFGPFPTFSTWPTIAHGVILLADAHEYGGVGTGMTIASRYITGGLYSENDDRHVEWERVFAAAGLPLVQPMAGMTELGTAKIVRDAGLSEVTRSCQLGSLDRPCYACMKCVRTEVVAALMDEAPLPSGTLARLAASPKVQSAIAADPVQMEHIFAYALPRTPGIDDTFLEPLLRRVVREPREVEFFSRYYGPAVDLLPERLRASVRKELEGRVGFMSVGEEEQLRQWRKGQMDRRPWLQRPQNTG